MNMAQYLYLLLLIIEEEKNTVQKLSCLYSNYLNNIQPNLQYLNDLFTTTFILFSI